MWIGCQPWSPRPNFFRRLFQTQRITLLHTPTRRLSGSHILSVSSCLEFPISTFASGFLDPFLSLRDPFLSPEVRLGEVEEIPKMVVEYVDLIRLRVFSMLWLYGMILEIFSGGSWALYQHLHYGPRGCTNCPIYVFCKLIVVDRPMQWDNVRLLHTTVA